MASPAQFLEQQSALRQAQNFQRAEESRVAARDAQAKLYENALSNPDTSPEDRKALLTQHAALFQPHEAPTLFGRLAGLIHGQQAMGAVPNAAAATPSQPTSSAAPTPPTHYQNELGDTVPHTMDANGQPIPPQPMARDVLGVPISDATVAAAHAEPLHPMAKSHPILDRLNEGLDALGNHLKGFAQPTPPFNPNANDALSRSYKSPISIARDTQRIAAENALDLAQKKGELNIEGRKVTAGGSSDQARYNRAFAAELGKEPSELTPDELKQAARENGEAKRRPQTLIDPTSGIVNIVTRDEEGNAVANPMRDSDGHLFGGFKPNSVTIRNGVYHFIGADNQVHEVPVTTTTTKIFGPHAQEGDKPLTLHKRDAELSPEPTPIAAEPIAPSIAQVNAAAVADKLNRKKSVSKQIPTAATPATNGIGSPYPGKVLGGAKLNSADRGVLEADQQIQDSIKTVLPVLEGMKDKNSLIDRGKMELAWQQYQHGISPSDPQLGEVIRNIALLQTQGAAPWTRIGRNKYTFEVIQKHLPQPTDTPKLMYDKVRWLSDNVIPSNVRATTNPNPSPNAPTSSKAPITPTDGMIQMRLPDGKIGPIHPSQLQNFLAIHPGAVQVQ